MHIHNLLQNLPVDLSREHMESLVCAAGVRIERIVSRGQVSCPGFWYDQSEDEWVMVLQGAARIRFETANEAVALEAGDSVNIPAHVRHRVDWTDPDQETVWLAVFYGGEVPQTVASQ